MMGQITPSNVSLSHSVVVKFVRNFLGDRTTSITWPTTGGSRLRYHVKLDLLVARHFANNKHREASVAMPLVLG